MISPSSKFKNHTGHARILCLATGIFCFTALLFFSIDCGGQVSFIDKIGVAKSGDSYEQVIDDLQTLAKEESLGQFPDTLAFIYHTIGVYQYRLGNIYEAIDITKEAVVVRKNHLPLDTLALRKSYRNLGAFYRLIHAYTDAHKSYLSLMDFGIIDPLYYAAKIGVGEVFRGKGDFRRALDHFENLLLEFNESKKKEYEIQYSNLLFLLGKSYAVLDSEQNLAKAIQFFDEGITICRKNLLVSQSKANIRRLILRLVEKGDTFRKLYKFQEAIGLYQEALDLLAQKPDLSLKATVLNNLGIVYEDMGALEAAREQYKNAFELKKEIYKADRHFSYATSYYNIGLIDLLHRDFPKALENFQYGLINICKGFTNENPTTNPDFSQLKNAEEKEKLLTFLIDKGNAWAAYADSFHDKSYIQNAINAYYCADQVVDIMRQEHIEKESKIFWRSQVYSLYENIIHTSILLDSFDKAFYYNEKGKSLLMREDFKAASAMNIIPEDLQWNGARLKHKITTLEKAIYQSENSEEFGNVDSLKQLLFFSKEAYHRFLEKIEREYSEYYHLKYNLQTTSIETIQAQLLNPDQSLLSFFVGDSTIYAFHITKSKQRIHQIPRNFPLTDWIVKMREGIFAGNVSQPTYNKQYVKYAHLLYQKLIESLGELNKELIIIPDGELGYIPFDALLMREPTNAGHFASHPYLATKYQISYNYSATLWQEMRGKKAQKGGLLAFAPYFEKAPEVQNLLAQTRDGLWHLAYNEAEVDGIQAQIGGKVLKGLVATAKNFSDLSKEYSILHIATHAKLNDDHVDYSYLAFTRTPDAEEHKIYIKDLYNMSLPLQMVVLSACETGIGELKKGEGIYSLARGFAYAGAKSIVHSLWSVNDQTSSEIMKNFYANLKGELSKDEALHRAKLTYLQKATTHETAHPFYWAAFAPIGDMSSIATGLRFDWQFLIALLILSVGLLIWKRFQ